MVMAGLESVIRTHLGCGAVAKHSILRSPPRICFFRVNQKKKFGRRVGRLVASLGGEDTDSLLQAAVWAASLRSQETHRPDPLFIDPYAGCFLSPVICQKDMGEECPTSETTLSPCHYRIATKFIDDKLLSMISSMDELRQIVLLTDGMDTRSYRLSWPRSSLIFDISPGRVFKVASQQLEGIGAKIPRTCVYLHVPLESSGLQISLCKKGFNGNKPSIWALQGLPLMTLTCFENILFVIGSLATKGCTFIGELPGWLVETEFGNRSTTQKWMEKLFMSHGFRVDMIDYDEVARNFHLDPPSRDNKNVLFIAEQLRLSDIQMESWRREFERLEEEGDEEGFEEL